MGVGELLRIGGGEVRGEHAFVDAPAAEDLAGGAGAEHGCSRRRGGRRGGGVGVEGRLGRGGVAGAHGRGVQAKREAENDWGFLRPRRMQVGAAAQAN
ncbi:hypothetical protein B296_00041163 [Ensete ventricosum]|uniref:Uncharacterized protein n=1 Tax=Ensete ventricosum TaxID=4639 RepID=A0A426ZMY2_ENSVE|nr:hypothetical protein B296_00041163 [Ensete ventricosum]